MIGKIIKNKKKDTFYVDIFIPTISLNIVNDFIRSILTAVNSGEISLWPFDRKEEVLINAGENLNRMCHSCMEKNIIATGGQENRLKLYDLEKQKQIFSEKNLSHDSLELRIPICISDLNFLPGTKQIATAGRYGHVKNTIFPFVNYAYYLQSIKYTLLMHE